MPNTKSARKAIKSSLRKRQNNNYWKNRIKASIKSIRKTLETKNPDNAILNKDFVVLQKTLDKASKNKVIHKNKANRLKSRYAQKITARAEKVDTKSEKIKTKSTRAKTSK
ncbi:30S ribosomal protein S20 [candidate division WWE3 bacterium RBG_19FT_COMBO_34_6]|uniref:Small ribosomal subunit protein bS20 n=1 Tax=candidate division WWE3 bacterium RBG_19FT_COMBO_34_6 TaxID=1802612 RepID=A0A1F4ULR2_UNCKA|nr:MAG: 30S ribosomal protein S20 [candidate division WWE3 bacterium RBG_19FT_COMBO_34_6]